jgi:hypothetical protein
VCAAALVPATEIVVLDEVLVSRLIADDADRPKELYARIGFDPVSRFWRSTKPPEGESHRSRCEIPGGGSFSATIRNPCL